MSPPAVLVETEVRSQSRHPVPLAGRWLWPTLAGLCCFAAFALRVFRLGRQSLWLDEGATYAFATMSPADLIAATFSREPNPPLYYLLVHGWIGLAGSSEFALRFSSVLAGVATVAVVFCLGRRLLGPAAALGAAALSAASPYLIWYSQEARMYALLGLLATATLLALWRATERPRWIAWAGFGLLLLLTLYTHFFGVLTMLVCAAFTFVTLARQEVRRGWPRPLLAFAVVAAAYVPWLLAILRAGAAESSWRATIDLGAIVWLSAKAFVHGGFLADPLGALLTLLVPSLAACGLVGITRIGRGRGWAAGLLAVALVLPSLAMFGLSHWQPVFADRYVIAQAPVFYLAIAAGLSSPPRRLTSLSFLGFAALTIVSLVATASAWRSPEFRKEDFRAVASYVTDHAGPGDLIVLVADYVKMPFAYYYRGPAALLPYTGIVERPEETLQPLVQGRDRVWLLLSHAEQVDPTGRIQSWLDGRFPTATEQFPRGIRLYGYRAAYRQTDLPNEATPLGLRFGDSIALAGYQAESGVPAADDRLHPPSNWVHVTLYWRALGPVSAAYRSSVRIMDGRGVWGDRLSRPGETLNFYQTNRWRPGELVVEDVDVNLNPVTPAGMFQLDVRLLGPDGQPLPVQGGPTQIGSVEIR